MLPVTINFRKLLAFLFCAIELYCTHVRFIFGPNIRYLLKTPDKWLNSTQGSAAKRKIQETLAAQIASGEMSPGCDSVFDQRGVGEEGSEVEKERQGN